MNPISDAAIKERALAKTVKWAEKNGLVVDNTNGNKLLQSLTAQGDTAITALNSLKEWSQKP